MKLTNKQLMKAIVDFVDESDMDDDLSDHIADNIEIIEEQEPIVDHKTVSTSVIYKWVPTDQYFKVIFNESNSGYWRDSEKYDTNIYEVEPKTVTVTKWVVKENK